MLGLEGGLPWDFWRIVTISPGPIDAGKALSTIRRSAGSSNRCLEGFQGPLRRAGTATILSIDLPFLPARSPTIFASAQQTPIRPLEEVRRGPWSVDGGVSETLGDLLGMHAFGDQQRGVPLPVDEAAGGSRFFSVAAGVRSRFWIRLLQGPRAWHTTTRIRAAVTSIRTGSNRCSSWYLVLPQREAARSWAAMEETNTSRWMPLRRPKRIKASVPARLVRNACSGAKVGRGHTIDERACSGRSQRKTPPWATECKSVDAAGFRTKAQTTKPAAVNAAQQARLRNPDAPVISTVCMEDFMMVTRLSLPDEHRLDGHPARIGYQRESEAFSRHEPPTGTISHENIRRRALSVVRRSSVWAVLLGIRQSSTVMDAGAVNRPPYPDRNAGQTRPGGEARRPLGMAVVGARVVAVADPLHHAGVLHLHGAGPHRAAAQAEGETDAGTYGRVRSHGRRPLTRPAGYITGRVEVGNPFPEL